MTVLIIIAVGVAIYLIYNANRKKHLSESSVSNNKKLWDTFKGKGNTDDILISKAQHLAPVLVEFAKSSTGIIVNDYKKQANVDVPDGKLLALSFEMVLFYVHVADRLAFQYLGADKRGTFIDVLFMEVRERISRIFDDAITAESFRRDFASQYNARQEEYGHYKKMYAEKDEGLGNTLVWEFGKKVSLLLSDSESGIFIIMATAAMVTDAIIGMEIVTLLSE